MPARPAAVFCILSNLNRVNQQEKLDRKAAAGYNNTAIENVHEGVVSAICVASQHPGRFSVWLVLNNQTHVCLALAIHGLRNKTITQV